MMPYNSEKLLAYFYAIGGTLSLLVTICMAIVWNHWSRVLNTCAGSFQSYETYYDERNCGCILHAKSTSTYFVGGEIGYCYWATFGLLIPLFFCFIFGIYHVFRVCFKSRGKPRSGSAHIRQRSQEIMTLTIEQEMVQDGISPYYWTPAAVISAVMIIYTLVHSIMLTDGFFKTCKQYRNVVVKNTQANGDMVGVIQGRLSCSAIFDFMDYLHPDLSFERRRDYRINTSIPLILAVTASWICVGCWVGALVINIMRARASRRLRI